MYLVCSITHKGCVCVCVYIDFNHIYNSVCLQVASVDEVDMEAIATIMDLVMMVDMATTHLMAVAIAAMAETKVMEEAKEVVAVDMEEMVAVEAAAMMATTVEVVEEE